MPIPQAKAAAKAKAKAQAAPPEVSMPAANAGAQPNPHVPDFVVGQMPSQISEMVSDSVRRSPFGLYADVSISHMEESGLSSGTVQQQEAVQEAQKDIENQAAEIARLKKAKADLESGGGGGGGFFSGWSKK